METDKNIKKDKAVTDMNAAGHDMIAKEEH